MSFACKLLSIAKSVVISGDNTVAAEHAHHPARVEIVAVSDPGRRSEAVANRVDVRFDAETHRFFHAHLAEARGGVTFESASDRDALRVRASGGHVVEHLDLVRA